MKQCVVTKIEIEDLGMPNSWRGYVNKDRFGNRAAVHFSGGIAEEYSLFRFSFSLFRFEKYSKGCQKS